MHFMSVPGLYISVFASATLRPFSGFLHLSVLLVIFFIEYFSNFTEYSNIK